jgi:DNA-binding transcriptional LysR family regulator
MAGSLRIGTYDSIGIYFWPTFLQHFLPTYPNLSLEFITGRSSLMKEKLDRGEIDLALIVNPKASSQLSAKNIYEDKFKFYEVAKGKKVYSSLENAPIILMPESLGVGKTVDEFLVEFNLEGRKVYQMSSLESAKELCLKGLGVALLPELVVLSSIREKKLKQVTELGAKNGLYPHYIGAMFHKSRKESVLINKVIESIVLDFKVQFTSKN